MDSGTACEPAPAGLLSASAVARDVSASPSERVTLRRAADYRRILSSGRRARRGSVTVVGMSNDTTSTRYGLVVGRGVGNAVERNRVKRRLRHALETVPLEQGMDYVIIADRKVLEAGFSDLERWLGAAAEVVG